jgi:hypothetical protein
MYSIQHCFICRPSDSTVSKDAVIEPKTVATDGGIAVLYAERKLSVNSKEMEEK